jgi:CheY-like chemotaxis protein
MTPPDMGFVKAASGSWRRRNARAAGTVPTKSKKYRSGNRRTHELFSVRSRGAEIQILRQISDTSPAGSPVVMVVDDEVLIRLVASDTLHDAGYRVVEACSADEAVTLLATDARIDLILSDVKMPGAMDGIDLVAHVKRAHPHLPVVLTSGHLAQHELFEAGATDWLPKPYSAAALLRAVERALGRSGE